MSAPRLFVVDVEADGPCPGLYSMVCFGAVELESGKVFYGQTGSVTEKWVPEALAVSGFTREQHVAFPHPRVTMTRFTGWLQAGPRPVFVSDNPAFDWQFINYYFHRYVGSNPFGFSARRIGDLYSGLVGDLRASNDWKKLRKTAHTHDPVDDARGNAEALREIIRRMEAKT